MGNFALIGVAGFVAERHLRAIRDTGNRLVAAVDPHDSVGILDRYFLETRYFSEIERFDRHMEKLRRGHAEDRVHWVSICSPNYLHDAHVRLAFRVKANAICEKPLVINPWNLDQLQELEAESGSRVFTVLQLRLHPALLGLKEQLDRVRSDRPADVILTYVTRRGSWYLHSWKGTPDKSGGLVMNIGIHFLDLFLWLFGSVNEGALHLDEPRRAAGVVRLERARVRWFLSVDENDLPAQARARGDYAFRSISIDGEAIEFSEGFGDLHTLLYQRTLAGSGFGIDDARPSIELVHRIRGAEVSSPGEDAHPLLRG